MRRQGYIAVGMLKSPGERTRYRNAAHQVTPPLSKVCKCRGME
ncbi:hypothetical protein E2C01_079618 [Portunus trituberculatus]|uniref:Uncharacterized protein n=1 Tax=Portunus trituberculatus TaxID=210409 RepID=A0A5B7IW39_PORTR|nr:hypothetical protein [Portunus trituberculatus]